MDFLDPKKKRAHLIRLYIGYALMAVALLIATFILAYATNGFGVDSKTGQVIQNGLIFVDAHPISATVYVDGQQKAQTDTRLVLPEGSHSLELKHDGYRSWSKEFELSGGSVLRYAYPFLFPQNLVTKDVELYGTNPGMSSASPDRHWLLVQQPNSLINFEVVDLNSKTNPVTTISLPSDLLTSKGATHTLEMVEWSTDNRHLLVKHSFEGGYEFIVIDREAPASSINVNKIFSVPITSMTLRDKHFDQYYLLDSNGGILRTADIKNKDTVSTILTHVVTFRPYGSNVILFVSDENADSGKVDAKVLENEKVYNLRQLPAAKTYLIDITQFNGKWYMAAGDDTEQRAYVYKDAFDDFHKNPSQIPTPISLLKVKTPEYLSFSTNARFIALQGGSEFAVYDAENNDQSRYDTKLTLLPGQKANWMDGHRLVIISDNKIVVFDFDGTNRQTLNDANPAHQVFFNRDYNAMFSLTLAGTQHLKPTLVRTELLVKP